jgi:glyceraldehyde-3-phosphate dehydrogenase/erythrose-4-phosphate dehydrogenase
VVKVAIVGLGRVGSTFLNNLIVYEDHSIKIVAAIEKSEDAPGLPLAKFEEIRVHNNLLELAAMGEDLDIIFDFSGSPETRKDLRKALASSGNRHTVIAPEVISLLIWNMMRVGEDFPEFHELKGY